MSDYDYPSLIHFSKNKKKDDEPKKPGRPSTRPDFAAKPRSNAPKRRIFFNVFNHMMPNLGKKKNPQSRSSDQPDISAEQRDAFFRRQEELRQKRIAQIQLEQQMVREISMAGTEVKTEAKENGYRQPEIANPVHTYDHIRKPRKKDLGFHPHNDLDKKRGESLSSASSSHASTQLRFAPYSRPPRLGRLLSSPASASPLFGIPVSGGSIPRVDSRMSISSLSSTDSSGQASPVSPTLSEDSLSDSSLSDIGPQSKKHG